MASQRYKGLIKVILGPMFSGKTKELIRHVERYEITKKCLIINYAKDNRYSTKEEIFAHNKKESVQAKKCYSLSDIGSSYQDYDVIAIDEGHFFPDLAEKAEEFADNGKIVVISALNSTFQRKSFGPIVDLLPLAEHVKFLSAICVGNGDEKCGNKASFTYRITKDKEIEVIGGLETYKPLCRKCYKEAEEQKAKGDF